MFEQKLLRCSFCGKDETQVSKLVAGPNVYICDTCVATARDIIDKSNGGDNRASRITSRRWHNLLTWITKFVSGGDIHRRIKTGVL